MSTSLARQNRVKELWLGLPETWRTHLASALNTFLATFLTELVFMLSTSSDFVPTRFMMFGALNAAIRAIVVKPTTSAVGSRTLPDSK